MKRANGTGSIVHRRDKKAGCHTPYIWMAVMTTTAAGSVFLLVVIRRTERPRTPSTGTG